MDNWIILEQIFYSLLKCDMPQVYYHPKSRKHLGIAYASFASSSSAKLVMARYHGTSIMGNLVCIRPDPLGKKSLKSWTISSLQIG